MDFWYLKDKLDDPNIRKQLEKIKPFNPNIQRSSR